MSEAARHLRANKAIQGQACPWCSERLIFGDEAAICQACQMPHHEACWNDEGGCATVGCVNKPLEQLEQAEEKEEVPAGKIKCPHCDRVYSKRQAICPSCKQAPTADGVYRGPTTNAPGAVSSLVCGIVGLFFCGIILGIVAIVQANSAKRAIERDPRYSGGGMATAGLVLGIIGLVLWALVILGQIATP